MKWRRAAGCGAPPSCRFAESARPSNAVARSPLDRCALLMRCVPFGPTDVIHTYITDEALPVGELASRRAGPHSRVHRVSAAFPA